MWRLIGIRASYLRYLLRLIDYYGIRDLGKLTSSITTKLVSNIQSKTHVIPPKEHGVGIPVEPAGTISKNVMWDRGLRQRFGPFRLVRVVYVVLVVYTLSRH